MDFDERLQRAIQRGARAGDEQARLEAERTLNEEELRRLHTQYRLELSEQIESCLSRLPDHFPGFRYETIVDDRGWGASVSRDDIDLRPSEPRGPGRRINFLSRLELVIRPFTSYRALELVAKGTIRNKEAFHRTHFQRLTEVVPDDFANLVNLWVLDYAEQFARAK